MTPKELKILVEKLSGVKISPHNRNEIFADARTVYAKLGNDYLRRFYTLKEIGFEIKRDHATLMHLACVSFAKRSQNPRFIELYNEAHAIVKDLVRDDDTRQREAQTLADRYDLKENQYLSEIKFLKETIKELRALKLGSFKGSASILKDPFFEEVTELTESQLITFKERASVMVRSIKSIKTYKNTDKSEFNA